MLGTWTNQKTQRAFCSIYFWVDYEKGKVHTNVEVMVYRRVRKQLLPRTKKIVCTKKRVSLFISDTKKNVYFLH